MDLIKKGDLIKVLPGCRLPTDGRVVGGDSYVDESMITGEGDRIGQASHSILSCSLVDCRLYRGKSVDHRLAVALVFLAFLPHFPLTFPSPLASQANQAPSDT